MHVQTVNLDMQSILLDVQPFMQSSRPLHSKVTTHEAFFCIKYCVHCNCCSFSGLPLTITIDVSARVGSLSTT